jgi:hypothetical protein
MWIDIVRDLLGGLVDLATAHDPPESPLLTCVQIAEQPFYIAMAKRDRLASNGVRARSIQHVIAPEEAFPFVSDGSAIASQF